MKRAFTLIEVLVSMAIFTLLCGVIVAVFILAHRYSRLYSQVSESQREAVRAMQGLQHELSRARVQTILPASAVNSTWFLSNDLSETQEGIVEFSSDGQVLWQKWVGIWISSDDQMLRSEIGLGGPKTLAEVSFSSQPDGIHHFQTGPSRRRLASSVAQFGVFPEDGETRVEILVETSLPGNPKTWYHLTSCFPNP